MSFLRFVLFCVFFAVGTAAIALSIQADEIQNLYKSKDILAKTLADNEKIIALEKDNDALVKHILENPEVLDRLKRVTLGEEPQAEDTIFPKVSHQQLAAAGQALFDNLESAPPELSIPQWVLRCAEPKSRMILFYCGAALILVAFVFFGTPTKKRIPTHNETTD